MQTAAQEAFSQIVWGKPLLRDLQVWQANIKVVEMLCKTCTVTEWLFGKPGKDGYIKFPYRYQIDGVDIEFLPHWGFYTVGGVNLNVPSTQYELNQAVNSVKNLKMLGFKPKKD
jgi:hypothetical protein